MKNNILKVAVGMALPVAAAFVAVAIHHPNAVVAFATGCAAGLGWTCFFWGWIPIARDAWRATFHNHYDPPPGSEQEAAGSLSDDARKLLDLFAITSKPAHLIYPAACLNPMPDGPSWRHPWRRYNTMTAWALRHQQLMTAARELAAAGMLRRTERGKRSDLDSCYEITDAGWAYLMQHLTEDVTS